MEHPQKIQQVVLDGHSLTLETFVAVARFGAKVSLSGPAREAISRSRTLAEKIAREKRVAYGITTGFLSLIHISWWCVPSFRSAAFCSWSPNGFCRPPASPSTT